MLHRPKLVPLFIVDVNYVASVNFVTTKLTAFTKVKDVGWSGMILLWLLWLRVCMHACVLACLRVCVLACIAFVIV